MIWNNAEIKPHVPGVYWVQSRSELAHLLVRYQSLYWSGRKWMVEPGESVYYWAIIEQAPEPENPLYYDELGRLDIVAAQERGVDLHTPIGTGSGMDADKLPDAISKLNELLMEVQNKYPGESRFETALRIIKQHENQDNAPEWNS
jgi:hypothetical protein